MQEPPILCQNDEDCHQRAWCNEGHCACFDAWANTGLPECRGMSLGSYIFLVADIPAQLALWFVICAHVTVLVQDFQYKLPLDLSRLKAHKLLFILSSISAFVILLMRRIVTDMFVLGYLNIRGFLARRYTPHILNAIQWLSIITYLVTTASVWHDTAIQAGIYQPSSWFGRHFILILCVGAAVLFLAMFAVLTIHAWRGGWALGGLLALLIGFIGYNASIKALLGGDLSLWDLMVLRWRNGFIFAQDHGHETDTDGSALGSSKADDTTQGDTEGLDRLHRLASSATSSGLDMESVSRQPDDDEPLGKLSSSTRLVELVDRNKVLHPALDFRNGRRRAVFNDVIALALIMVTTTGLSCFLALVVIFLPLYYAQMVASLVICTYVTGNLTTLYYLSHSFRLFIKECCSSSGLPSELFRRYKVASRERLRADSVSLTRK